MGDKMVLVVEDETDLRSFVEAVLASEGYQVLGAGNGREALEEVARQKPDIILLDMRLPIMDGWEFAREFNARYDDRTPIVVMTAHQARQIAREIGAKDYLQKPFELEDLLNVVKRASKPDS